MNPPLIQSDCCSHWFIHSYWHFRLTVGIHLHVFNWETDIFFSMWPLDKVSLEGVGGTPLGFRVPESFNPVSHLFSKRMHTLGRKQVPLNSVGLASE